MVEAIEFPHLTMRYNVSGVPMTVVNETLRIEGSAPEPMLMQRIVEYTRQSMSDAKPDV